MYTRSASPRRGSTARVRHGARWNSAGVCRPFTLQGVGHVSRSPGGFDLLGPWTPWFPPAPLAADRPVAGDAGLCFWASRVRCRFDNVLCGFATRDNGSTRVCDASSVHYIPCPSAVSRQPHRERVINVVCIASHWVLPLRPRYGFM